MRYKVIKLSCLLVLGCFGLAQAANFTVDIAADDADAHDSNPGDGICSDAFATCTLRAAIEEANALAGSDVILFADGLSEQTLVVAASEGPLPVITTQIFILGYSIDAYNSAATLLRDAPPQFTVDGSQLSSGNGFLYSGTGASGSVLSALGIVNFPSDGVVMALGADNISINRSYIGIHPNGTVAGNGGHGINAVITDDHKIGKTRHSNGTQFVSLGNVISANGAAGIRLFDSNDNVINGNLIGLAPSGTSDRGNGQYGIDMSGNNNQVGDFINSLLAGNFLAANDSGGLLIDGDNNRVYTNQLGKGETGSFINSEGHGITVLGNLNFIGNNDNAKNKIYEHQGSAIKLGVANATSANSNFIINNNIGSSGGGFPLNLSGNGTGVEVSNGNTNLIQDNLVLNSGIDSGIGYGITVRGDSTTISGNQVGYIDVLFGVSAESNQATAIRVIGNNNVIGTAANPNYVGGNAFTGIYAEGEDIHVAYNRIGVNEAYEKIGNGGIGLQVLHNGGGLIIENNVIGDNSSGMVLEYPANTPNIRFNQIGVTPTGADIGNDLWGIRVIAGINIDLSYNDIAFNGMAGIAVVADVLDSVSAGVAIFQNSIHSNAGLGVDLNDDGLTQNDVGDIDEGNNRLQNTPVIESVIFDQVADPATLTISYRVDSNSGPSSYPLFVDFYWSEANEVAQGRHFLSTDFTYATPNALKTVTFDFNSAALGGFLTATALDQGRHSSEFSASQQFGEVDLIFKHGFEGE